jgi:hypothetical protein
MKRLVKLLKPAGALFVPPPLSRIYSLQRVSPRGPPSFHLRDDGKPYWNTYRKSLGNPPWRKWRRRYLLYFYEELLHCQQFH